MVKIPLHGIVPGYNFSEHRKPESRNAFLLSVCCNLPIGKFMGAWRYSFNWQTSIHPVELRRFSYPKIITLNFKTRNGICKFVRYETH